MRIATSWVTFCFLAVIAAGLTGCASFERDWRQASMGADAVGADAAGGSGKMLEGRWEGNWQSDKNQHRGALRCIVSHVTNEVYLARYHARYRKLFNLTFGYTARLEARPAGDHVTFSGEADLGWYAGGRYRYEGHATATHFQSTYSSRYDYGMFHLSRPANR